MMNMRERYDTDPAFHQMVDMFRACIERGDYTPTEIREAAMLAQLIYEETHLRPTYFTRDQFFGGKV